jgi:DNA polymerase III subunit epsilon
MRQIVLDTETTGLDPARGHRVVEIGCVELVERRRSGREFQRYLNPERSMDLGALEVTGLSDDFLRDKPLFRAVAHEFLEFIDGAELIIHNAAFDLGFLNAELALLGGSLGRIQDRCTVLDTLAMARERYPGQKNSLDALCRRLQVDSSHRRVHGALLDANLLSDVYLAMTAGQGDLSLAMAEPAMVRQQDVSLHRSVATVRVVRAAAEDEAAHAARLQAVQKASKGQCLWLAESG